jgi:hypothetical protein
MKKYLFVLLCFCLMMNKSYSQETYLPFGSDEYQLLERLETRSGRLSNRLFLNTRPVSRRSLVEYLASTKSNFYNSGLTNIDFFNINRAISISGEFAKPNGKGAVRSKHPVLNTFYKTQPDLINVNQDGYSLVINPILSFQGIYEKDKVRSGLFNTTQGAEMRGKLKDYAAFYFSITNNYEQPPTYVNDWINHYHAIPGAGKYNVSGNGYQYLKIRGYADVPLIRNTISLSLGYDQHFIGDGYRSLFLSDFAEGAAFARINTKIWKLNYQNLYMMLKPQQMPGEVPATGYKYATVHYLSLNVTRWLNIGLFESVTFARNGHYEFGYVNPIIFYRAIERGLGSPDKVALGFSGKIIALKHVNLYTQILINEFTSKELFAGNGYWANKWGVQLGAKYFDAFGLGNLDLQGEVNIVRPYTYQHYSGPDGNTIANNTTYNQALAHPLGAGFAEVTGFVNYQPLPRLTINAKAMYYAQGIDTNGSNNGSNILLDYNTRKNDFGVKLINGPKANCMLLSLNASYELKPRLYFDIGGTYRKYDVENNLQSEQSSFMLTAGLRLNLARKDYTQF